MGISILIVDDDKLLVEKLEETVNWSGIAKEDILAIPTGSYPRRTKIRL